MPLIYQNDNDLLNLVEILSKVSFLISPSTGSIHLASNLDIPTLGLYSKKDTIKWATQDRRYIILDKEINQLTVEEVRIYKNEALEILKAFLEKQ